MKSLNVGFVVFVIVSLFVASCSTAVAPTPTMSVEEKARLLFTQTAQSPASGTMTMEAAFRLLVQATQTAENREALKKFSLSKKLVLQTGESILYPSSWTSPAPHHGDNDGSFVSAGLRFDSFFVGVNISTKSVTGVPTVSEVGNDPVSAIHILSKKGSMLIYGKPIGRTFDGHIGAYVEVDGPYNDGTVTTTARYLEVLVLVDGTTYCRFMIFVSDKSHWDEIKPLVYQMLETISIR